MTALKRNLADAQQLVWKPVGSATMMARAVKAKWLGVATTATLVLGISLVIFGHGLTANAGIVLLGATLFMMLLNPCGIWILSLRDAAMTLGAEAATTEQLETISGLMHECSARDVDDRLAVIRKQLDGMDDLCEHDAGTLIAALELVNGQNARRAALADVKGERA